MRFTVFLPRSAWRALPSLTLMLLARTARAQGQAELDPNIPSLSLPAALAYAQAHQPELLAASERLRAVQAEAEVAPAQWQPSFGALGEFVESTTNNSTATPLSESGVDLPRIGGTTISQQPGWRPEPTTLLAIGGRQELYDFGRIAAQSAAARALSAITQSEVRHTRLDLRLAVTNAYYAVRAAHALLEVATQAESRALLHRDLALATVSGGLRSAIEATRADADVARFEVARIHAEGGLLLARGVFAAAVGYEQPELDAGDEPSAAPALTSLANAEARAVEADPAVQEAVGHVRAEHSQADAIAALLRPNLFVSVSASLRAGGAAASDAVSLDGRGLEPIVPNYSAGVVLNWPFFEPTVLARVRAAHAREHAAASEVEVARQRAFSHTRQAYQNVKMAQVALSALAKSVRAARANHEQAEGRFRAGLGTATELADAETLRLNAEVDQVIGQFQAATTRAELSRAIADGP